jgi:hypothetical protein
MIDFVDLMDSRSLSINSEKEEDKFWFSGQWIMYPTYLGVRYQGLVCNSGEIKFHGKKKQYGDEDKIQKLTRIVESLKQSKLPDQTLFECYLTFNNDMSKSFSFLKLDDLNENLLNEAKIYITDLIYLGGKDVYSLPLFDRMNILKKNFIENDVVVIQQGYLNNKKKVFESLKNDFSVFIFKDLTAPYKFRQSTCSRIYKLPFQYFMVVMDYVQSSDPKLKNMVLSIVGGQFKDGELKKIMNIPVHGNDARIILFNKKQENLGKVFEILASEKTEDDEKYQEARFVRIRNDKKIEECIF